MIVVERFRETWPLRKGEWMLALITAGLGAVYLLDPPLFQLPNYSTLRKMMPREAWGVLALAVGAIRLGCLYINGAWRASPHLRAAGAFLTCFLWLTLFLGAATADTIGGTIIMYFVFLLFDALAVIDAAGEAGRADHKARNLRENRSRNGDSGNR